MVLIKLVILLILLMKMGLNGFIKVKKMDEIDGWVFFLKTNPEVHMIYVGVIICFIILLEIFVFYYLISIIV